MIGKKFIVIIILLVVCVIVYSYCDGKSNEIEKYTYIRGGRRYPRYRRGLRRYHRYPYGIYGYPFDYYVV